jgi:hypothetical protein
MTLHDALGKAMTPKELGGYLGIDARTVVKYADYWGGIEVSPGKYRFFEKKIMEVINADGNNQTWEKKVDRFRDGFRGKVVEGVSGRVKAIISGRGSVGSGRKKTDFGGDRHGLLDDGLQMG